MSASNSLTRIVVASLRRHSRDAAAAITTSATPTLARAAASPSVAAKVGPPALLSSPWRRHGRFMLEKRSEILSVDSDSCGLDGPTASASSAKGYCGSPLPQQCGAPPPLRRGLYHGSSVESVTAIHFGRDGFRRERLAFCTAAQALASSFASPVVTPDDLMTSTATEQLPERDVAAFIDAARSVLDDSGARGFKAVLEIAAELGDVAVEFDPVIEELPIDAVTAFTLDGCTTLAIPPQNVVETRIVFFPDV